MRLAKFDEFIGSKAFYNDSLCPLFWKGWEFDPTVRTKLLQIAQDFYEDLDVEIPILDVQLTGSLANYNWTEYSDLDVHVIMDLGQVNQDIELVKKAMDGLRFQWNQRHPVEIRGHDVELYAQDINQLHLASGLYSLQKGEWLRQPMFKPPAVDPLDVDRKVQAYGVQISNLKQRLASSNPAEAKDILELASVLKKKISRARDEQLAHEGGEFSIENLVFKQMRNNGMFGDLIDIKAEAYSRMYSEPHDVKIEKENEGINV
jgi:hypothetical protein